MERKLQAFCLFFLFSLMASGCDYDCTDCQNPDDNRPEWLPDNAIRNPGLRIHAIRIWEPEHRFDFQEIYELNNMDFCLTLDSSSIPKIKSVRGDLLTTDGRIDKSFLLELWETEELIGVYCKRLLINDQYSHDIVIFRGTVVDHDWNWNQRTMEVIFVPQEPIL